MKKHNKKNRQKNSQKKKTRELCFIREYYISDAVKKFNDIDDGTCELKGITTDSDYIVLVYYKYN